MFVPRYWPFSCLNSHLLSQGFQGSPCYDILFEVYCHLLSDLALRPLNFHKILFLHLLSEFFCGFGNFVLISWKLSTHGKNLMGK